MAKTKAAVCLCSSRSQGPQRDDSKRSYSTLFAALLVLSLLLPWDANSDVLALSNSAASTSELEECFEAGVEEEIWGLLPTSWSCLSGIEADHTSLMYDSNALGLVVARCTFDLSSGWFMHLRI